MESIPVKSSAQRARELVANPEAYFASCRAEAHEIANRSVTERAQRVVETRRNKRKAFWRGAWKLLRRRS